MNDALTVFRCPDRDLQKELDRNFLRPLIHGSFLMSCLDNFLIVSRGRRADESRHNARVIELALACVYNSTLTA